MEMAPWIGDQPTAAPSQHEQNMAIQEGPESALSVVKSVSAFGHKITHISFSKTFTGYNAPLTTNERNNRIAFLELNRSLFKSRSFTN
jgi:hypothetical protein